MPTMYLPYIYLDLAFLALGFILLFNLAKALRQYTKTTKLPAPRTHNWLFGFSREIFLDVKGDIFGEWYDELQAPVYALPGPFGSKRVVLMDPKAISYFYANDSYGFMQSQSSKKFISRLIGYGLSWSDGDSHKRQRKILSPAFSLVTLRKLQPVFYDSAYKVKAHWEELLSSSNEAIINVQEWMSSIALDSIGIAGFAHDFGAIAGRQSSVKAMFDAFSSNNQSNLTVTLSTLAQQVPALIIIPTKRMRLIRKLHESMHGISMELLERSRKERELGVSTADGGNGWAGKTIIGSLFKSENSTSESTITQEEALAQMKGLLFAGNETTSLALTWALIELALNPNMQDRLRAELDSLGGQDPTYEQLKNELPYLDAVFHETLRMHSPVSVTMRVATHDHVIPLSSPIRTPSGDGKPLNHICIARGTMVIIPIRGINCSKVFWGPDAKKFQPERWLRLRGENGNAKNAENEKAGRGEKMDGDGSGSGLARELQGFHHLLSFGDGPRMCLGKHFAVMEFKTVLAVLIRNYTFALRDGPETKFETVFSLFQRPRVVGEPAVSMPMRVRRVE